MHELAKALAAVSLLVGLAGLVLAALGVIWARSAGTSPRLALCCLAGNVIFLVVAGWVILS